MGVSTLNYTYQCADFLIYNANRTAWSPVQSVIIRVVERKSSFLNIVIENMHENNLQNGY